MSPNCELFDLRYCLPELSYNPNTDSEERFQCEIRGLTQMVARAREIAETAVGEPWPVAVALPQRTARSYLLG